MLRGSILVTGASGLLGSSLVPRLKNFGYKVVTHACVSQADVMINLFDRQKTFEMLERIQPKVIINLVGLTNVELCEQQVSLAYLANARTVENLVSWIAAVGTRCHLIQVSTDHVYDGAGVHSEDEVAITNNYAFSKYAGELAALRVPSTVLRTNFVGRSNKIGRESLTDWVYNSLTANISVQVLSDIYFSPLSISILAEMIELVVQEKPIGIFNLGSHGGMSKADFNFAFAESLKLQTKNMSRIKACEAKFLSTYRPKDMRMNSTKFENRLGVKLPQLKELIQHLAWEYNGQT